MKKSLFFLFCTFLYFSVSAQILTGPSGAGRQEQFFKALKGSFPALVSDTTAAKANGYFPENATNGNREGMIIRYTADFKLYELIKDGSSYYWKPVGGTTINPDQFIRNGTTSQTANFNITGTGQGGILRGNTRLEAGVDWWLVGSSGSFSLQYPGGSRTPIFVSSSGLVSLDGGQTLENGNFTMDMEGSGSPRYMQFTNFTHANHAGSLNDSLLTYDPVSSRMKRIAFSIPWSKITGAPGFEPAIAAGTTGQYWRGDKTWQTLNTTVVPEGTNLYWTNARGDARYPQLTGSYANPTWISSLAWSKITGVPASFPTSSNLNAVAANGNTTTRLLQITDQVSIPSSGSGLELFAGVGGVSAVVQGRNRGAGDPFVPVNITGGTTAARTLVVSNDLTYNGAQVWRQGNNNFGNNNITLGAAGNVNEYYIELLRNLNSVDRVGRLTLTGNSTVGYGPAIHALGSPSRLLILPENGASSYFSPDGGTNYYQMWHSNNHPAGSAFTPTLTGANVLSTMSVNSAGHVTALTTRALTAADIDAAPGSGSGNYIQNQVAGAQSPGNFHIVGNGRSNNQFIVSKNGLNTVNGFFTLYNADATRGATLQLNADANPGLATWIHNGTTWVKRAEQFSGNGMLRIFSDAGEGLRLFRPAGVLNGGTGSISFEYGNGSVTTSPVVYAQVYGVATNVTAAAESGAIVFNTRNAGSLTEKMRLTSGGNLLINSSVENGDRLQVEGTASVSSTVTAPILQSPSGEDLLLLANAAPTGAQVRLNNQGLGIGGNPGGIHSERLLVAGNAVANDAWIVDGGGVIGEFFLDGGLGAGVRTTTNHPLKFYSNNLERMNLNTSGQVAFSAGIIEKTTSSTSTAYVVAATDHVIKLDPAGTGGTGTITLPNPATSEGRELKIIAVDGATYTSNFSITQPTSLGPPTTSIQGVFIIQAIAGTWYLISKL